MTRDLELYPGEVLEQECRPVDNPGEWDGLIGDMETVLYEHDGIGLAAPQVGETIQLFLLRLDAEKRLHEAYFNPEILDLETEETLVEGCLSFPNIEVKIDRATRVKFTAETPAGEEVTRTVEGLQAQCVQHEIDHLHGKTLLDNCDLTQTMRIQDKLNMLENGKIPPRDKEQQFQSPSESHVDS
ncbi:MAG: peptide deformylase [bacterium]